MVGKVLLVILCTLQYLDQDIFYFSLDARMVVELIKTQLAYLKTNWKQMGRPTFPIPVLHSMMGKLPIPVLHYMYDQYI